jgi:hypothetical protein
MNRWVPRHVLEKAFQGVSEGFDDQALQEEAREDGRYSQPAVGAAVGAILAHHGLGASPLGSALGGLAGAGAGAYLHERGAPGRVANMREALKGVHREREHTQESAREAVPMVIAASNGEV